MSRSTRKLPIAGITICRSEKDDKRKWHRALRRKANQLPTDADELDFPHRNAVSDPWWMGKDGKKWFGWEVAKNTRLMRK